MRKYTEKRFYPRSMHKAPVLIQKLNDRFLYRARMINYCDNGLYLETDAVLDPKSGIIIGIENSPFSVQSSSSDTLQFYLTKVVRRIDLKDEIFHFGYGVKIISRVRQHRRKSYVKTVLFKSNNQYYKGLIKNISRSGIYIETQDKFTIGKIIKIGVPGSKSDKIMLLRGKIVRLDRTGIGVKFKGLLTERASIEDRGGRRSGTDRRELFFAEYIPEKRSDVDRRTGLDRRKIKNVKFRKGLKLRDILET